MSLLSPQCTCIEGSCTSWLKEVWLKDHSNFHSLECFVRQCTSLVDESLFSYMMLNTRNAVMKWVTHAFMQCLWKFTCQYSHPATLLPPTGTVCSPDASIASENKAGWTHHIILQSPDQHLSVYSTHPFAEHQSHKSQSTTKKKKKNPNDLNN